MAETLNLLTGLAATQGSDTNLKYPKDIFDGSTDYVKFQFYKYKGPFASANAAGSGTPSTTDTTGKEAKEEPSVTDFDKYNTADYEPYGVSNVIFYMPEDISTGYNFSWGGKDFSNIGAQLMKGGGTLLSGDAGGTAAAITNLVTNAMGALPTAGAEAIANGINATGAGNVTTNDVLGGSLGVILNPNTELLFDGFKMRSFTLRFKMVPRNKSEAQEMRKIIGTFKKVASPTYGLPPDGALDLTSGLAKLFGKGETPTDDAEKDKETEPAASTDTSGSAFGASNANYIGVPGLCQVKFMKGSKLHPYLPQYKICAIADISVNYTPDGVYATYYDDGAPVAVELSLSFAETKLIYSDDIVLDGASY
ncbi:MAG: hypothetical protein ACO3CD_02705 [Candidatus Nanopelagicaceae bacterium]